MIKQLKREKLRHGDILHCTGNSWLQKIIQWATKSRIAHTATVINIGGKLFIADSQANGTNLKTIENWNNKYNYTYTLHRFKEPDILWDELIYNRIISKIGVTGYDYASLLIWQPWYLLTGKWKGHTKEEAEKRMYCSEFVAWVHGFDMFWELSPQALFNELKVHGDYKYIK